MRIGVVLGSCVPESGGGYTFSEEILKALREVDTVHDFVVIGEVPASKVDVLSGEHVTIRRVRESVFKRVRVHVNRMVESVVGGTYFGQYLFRGNWLKRIVRQQRLGFVWFITPKFIDVDVPFIVTVWDLQHRRQPWFPEVSSRGNWALRERNYSTALRRAAYVIVGTKAGRDEVVSYYNVDRERVLNLGHPTPAVSRELGTGNGAAMLGRYGIPPDYLLYPAQFWPHKNHINLLLALKLLNEEFGMTLSLVLVGSNKGSLEFVKRKVEEYGQTSRVFFPGFVTRGELIDLFCNASALTYVTYFGPENLPPLEAFALGCPVVASNVAGAGEQLGDAAVLVDPDDPRDIARAVKRVHDDSALREALIRRGRERAARWTPKHFVGAVIEALDRFEVVRRCWDTPR